MFDIGEPSEASCIQPTLVSDTDTDGAIFLTR